MGKIRTYHLLHCSTTSCLRMNIEQINYVHPCRQLQTHLMLASKVLEAFQYQTLIFTYANAPGKRAKVAKLHHPLSVLRILAKESRKMLPYPTRLKRSNLIAPQSLYFKTAFWMQPHLAPQVMVGSTRLQGDQKTVIETSESSCYSTAL